MKATDNSPPGSDAAAVGVKEELELMAKALQSLHDLQCHTQAVLCALVDTHPAPEKAAAAYEKYLSQFQQAGSVPQAESYDLLRSAWRARFATAAAALERDDLLQSLRTRK